MKRFRPRFSIRTLVFLITLVCCYAACWGPTKKRGVPDVRKHSNHIAIEYDIGDPEILAITPLLLRTDMPLVLRTSYGVTIEPNSRVRSYYFWFFGYVAKLPYERELTL